MKSLSLSLLLVALVLAGCSSTGLQRAASVTSENRAKANLTDQPVKQPEQSLDETAKMIPTEAGIDRKIIRNADLSIEVNSTTQAQQQVTTIAESHGGFVVTSEAKQRESADPAQRIVDYKLVVRIPSQQFNASLDQIEKLAANLTQRNVTGQDVTEEFIDLEARIRTQKALELQFLEIMKQANKVADALEVNRQVAEVRSEIERLEGRKRFLQNQSALSTITVNISTPRPIAVSASGFGHSVREAVSDSLDLASGMILFFVRFVIVMAPIVVFVLLPLAVVALYLRRRAQRIRLATLAANQ